MAALLRGPLTHLRRVTATATTTARALTAKAAAQPTQRSALHTLLLRTNAKRTPQLLTPASLLLSRAAAASSSTAAAARRLFGTAHPALRMGGSSPAAGAGAGSALRTPHVDQYFGVNVYDRRAMKETLPPAVYSTYIDAVNQSKGIDMETADAIAKALLRWAQARGATHFTHWFQPLNGVPAEKHDTFLDTQSDGETPLTRFRGKDLIMGEPDGSSFPSGGLRVTHTARGYTAWDPASHPFLIEHGNGSTLYIPACFFSWKDNQALDDKTVLLRASAALRTSALALFEALGDTKQTSIHTDSGLEQEFFLIDRSYYLKRPDLMVAGRTLLGAPPPKGQELEDQYFGPKSERFLDCIHAFEMEMWKLGVPIQTRHREVAPGQYEVAPRFATANIAVDRNLLMMEVLRRVARKHDLAALLHEKPFRGVNGSGKHNNWSFGTNTTPSVLTPGPNPESNLQFMLFLSATLRAVDEHADLLRWSIAGAGNDHRLGANEAPPAIISAYLGDDINEAVQRFVANDKSPSKVNLNIDLGVPTLPPLKRAPTDRNRTSPFAFTGNKFEFRAVGSSHTPSRSNMVLNTILADALRHITREIKAARAAGQSAEQAMESVARATLKAHSRIVFNGNGYSAEWQEEAARRGLMNMRATPDALAPLTSPKNLELFRSLGVLSAEELAARYTVGHAEYCHKLLIEAKVLTDLVLNHVVPAATEYQVLVAGAIAAVKAATAIDTKGGSSGSGANTKSQVQLLSTLTSQLNKLIEDVEQLDAFIEESEALDVVKQARFHHDNTVPAMLRIREAADVLETLVPASKWPLPTYHQMLFHQD